MSQADVEIVRRLNGALLGQDPQPPNAFLAPDAVWDMTTFDGWPDRPEYRGLEEYSNFMETWVAPYEEWSYELEELIDAGDSKVVARLSQRGKLRGGGGWVDQRYGILYTVEGGRVQRAQVYASVGEALAAVGLSE
jgi:ketosteroid isomerase-like protein